MTTPNAHTPDGTCCHGAGYVVIRPTLTTSQLGSRPYYFTLSFCQRAAALAGATCRILHRFTSNGTPTSYTLEAPDGWVFHFPSLYCDEQVSAQPRDSQHHSTPKVTA